MWHVKSLVHWKHHWATPCSEWPVPSIDSLFSAQIVKTCTVHRCVILSCSFFKMIYLSCYNQYYLELLACQCNLPCCFPERNMMNTIYVFFNLIANNSACERGLSLNIRVHTFIMTKIESKWAWAFDRNINKTAWSYSSMITVHTSDNHALCGRGWSQYTEQTRTKARKAKLDKSMQGPVQGTRTQQWPSWYSAQTEKTTGQGDANFCSKRLTMYANTLKLRKSIWWRGIGHRN